tara:strand:- start:774 stop:1709 length:936 start_codon:yes stop_codon:yes gene_type:complete
MSRAGITNTLIENGIKERNIDIDTSAQLSMYDIWDNIDDTHETTYQLISPEGDIFDLTFSTNDPRAFDNWCVEEGLNPEKVHAIAKEGLNSAHKDWFVKIIDTPVEIPEKEPESVVEAAPKKPKKKRRTKAQIEADKVAKEKKDVGNSVSEGAGTKKPKKKRRTKAQIEADKVAKEKKDVGNSVSEGAGTKKPKKKRRTKAQIEADKVTKATEKPKRKTRKKKPIKVLELNSKVEDELPEPIFDLDHAQDQVIAEIFTEEKVKNDDGWDEIELKVIDENIDEMRPVAFKQSAETIPMNRKQRRAAKKQKRK